MIKHDGFQSTYYKVLKLDTRKGSLFWEMIKFLIKLLLRLRYHCTLASDNYLFPSRF